MFGLLTASTLFAAFGFGWFMMNKQHGQQHADLNRKYYDVIFPNEMSDKEIHAFIRAIGKNLKSRNKFGGVPTVVFETWAQADGGITHRLRVPSDAATYLIGQLQNALPGIDVAELPGKDELGFQAGAVMHMRNSSEELPIVSAMDYSHRLLASMQDAVKPHDAVVVQTIIAHSDDQKMPPSDQPVPSKRVGLASALMGTNKAGHDEVVSRRNKQVDQNYVAIVRVAARGEDPNRALQLTHQVVRAITSEGGNAHFTASGVDPQRISKAIKHAVTPMRMTAQLSVTELAAVIGWPMGDVYVPGLRRGSTRHMPAPESVSRTGLTIGKSTMPGIDRPIGIEYEAALSHILAVGNTGTGKSTLFENLVRQVLDRGSGLFLIERDGNLFQKTLDQIPPHRKDDVICIDLERWDNPLGFNILRTGKAEIVVGRLNTLLNSLFPDASKSIYTDQIVQFGIPVIHNLERATIADLQVLAHPRNPAELAWFEWAVAQHPDKTIRDFWKEWSKDFKSKDQKQISQKTQAFKNRMWALMTAEPVRYLLNQESSSFDFLDILNTNKIFAVNLAGAPEQAASLIGSLFMAALADAAKVSSPTKENYVIVDEFQQFSHLQDEFVDMLRTIRKRKVGLMLATQNIEQLPTNLQDATMANARTKLAFQSAAKSADVLARNYAHAYVKRESFINLKAYDMIGVINTRTGVSDPVTIHTFDSLPGYNFGRDIMTSSSRRFGRTKPRIDQDDRTRRIAPRMETEPEPSHEDIGETGNYNDIGE